MKNVNSIEFQAGTKEELLPGFTAGFPYIATRAELDKYIGRYVPWHWHKTVELFYMESGMAEYGTPNGNVLFTPGAAGFVNSNVLHMSRPQSEREQNIQLPHIFDPSFLSGPPGGLIEQKYITPVIAAPRAEIIALYPDNPPPV